MQLCMHLALTHGHFHTVRVHNILAQDKILTTQLWFKLFKVNLKT